jgi:quercetin dioxygenase-like cupin family protein
MFGEIHFKKGDTLPRHSDDIEQFTYVVEGALKFWFGDDGKQEMVVSAWCVRLS